MSTPANFPANMTVLSLAAAADRSRLASGDSWLMLVDFNWQGQHLRLVRNVNNWTFDAGDGLGPQSYEAFNMELEVELPSGSQLASMTLKASNILGLLQTEIEQYAGGVGATASIYFLDTAAPGGEAELAIVASILQTDVLVETVNFKLGPPSPAKLLFPRFLYRANFCIWIVNYKGPQCGYVGEIATCDGTLDGGNGCKVHANQQRFGGFPGIGTNGASIAGQT